MVFENKIIDYYILPQQLGLINRSYVNVAN